MSKRITQQYLKSVLEYNPETGVLTWRKRNDVDNSWNTKYAGKKIGWSHSHGYIQLCINYNKYYAHRIVWLYMTGKWPKEIDHIDTNKGNNKFSNLREVTHVQNGYNRAKHKDNLSGYKGVTYDKRDATWMANITVNKKTIYLGRFKGPASAHIAYCRAAKKYHGEFARTV